MATFRYEEDTMNDPFYDSYYLLENILKDVKDINPKRNVLEYPKNRWIFPSITTSSDAMYPRLVIRLNGVHPTPISSEGYMCEDDKSQTFATKLTLDYEIILYVKREETYQMLIGHNQIKAKNDLLINSLFHQLLNKIHRSEKEITKNVFYYNPNSISTSIGYEDSTNRLIRTIHLSFDVLSYDVVEYDEGELIRKINLKINDLVTKELMFEGEYDEDRN